MTRKNRNHIGVHLCLSVVCFCLSASAADKITASFYVTNTAGTTNGQTITINGLTRTWTNTVFVPSTQILTNSTAAGAKSNLFNQLALNPIASITLNDKGATNFNILAGTGVPLTVTFSVGWAIVSYSTQAVVTPRPLMVPIASEVGPGVAIDNASLAAKGISDLSTNAFDDASTAMSEVVGLTTLQAITGQKYFAGITTVSNRAGVFWVGVVFATNLNGIVGSLTNGTFYTNVFDSPTTTNLINYGNAISSPGDGLGGQQFGVGAIASGVSSLAMGVGALASTNDSTAVGFGAHATGRGSTALGKGASAIGTNSTALGNGASALLDNQTVIGKAGVSVHIHNVLEVGGSLGGALGGTSYTGSNIFNGYIALTRYNLTTLANGINDDIDVQTNSNVYVTGPSGAFSIRGIAGGVADRVVIIENDTGFDMAIAVEGGVIGNDPIAINRITSNTGADRPGSGNSTAILKYNGVSSRWKLISFDP